jgi:hypothetical protein
MAKPQESHKRLIADSLSNWLDTGKKKTEKASV